jgi:hypothetical protein
MENELTDLRIKSAGFQRGFVSFVLLIIACACSPRQPAQSFTVGALLREVRFESATDWEAYQDAALGVAGAVRGGTYRIDIADGGFMWALHDQVETDVVIEAETQQLSAYRNTAYGVMCRASPSANGNGYYFFISADGYYSIRRGAGREVLDLIPFTFSERVRQGTDFNRIRAVCVGDYLALFANGFLLGEVRDGLYHSGTAGLTAAVPDGGDVSVEFDNVLIFTAQPG